MTKYAVFTNDGFPNGFYAEDVHGERFIDGKPNPQCLIPSDAIEITDEQWQTLLSGGHKWDGAQVIEFVPPPPSPIIPDRVSSRQFFMMLDKMDVTTNPGIYNQVDGWVALQPRAIRLVYEKAGSFVRTDEMLQEGFVALGFTPEQIDAFFTTANTL